jgi:hypothetical protein
MHFTNIEWTHFLTWMLYPRQVETEWDVTLLFFGCKLVRLIAVYHQWESDAFTNINFQEYSSIGVSGMTVVYNLDRQNVESEDERT